MNSSKLINSRKSSVTQKSDLGDVQSKDVENNRQTNGGYSWWKWRRSTDSTEKKSPPKDILDDSGRSERQSVERVDEMKEVIHDFDNMTIADKTAAGVGSTTASFDASTAVTNVPDSNVDELIDSHTLNADHADVLGRNDDSISSELADISKSSFTTEKYRKTLRLTSEQIVSELLNFRVKFGSVKCLCGFFFLF